MAGLLLCVWRGGQRIGEAAHPGPIASSRVTLQLADCLLMTDMSAAAPAGKYAPSGSTSASLCNAGYFGSKYERLKRISGG